MTEAPLESDQRFIRIQNYIDRMPSLSTTVTKVLDICNRPDTSANDLNRVISLDPVLTGQVLRLVNSAYYGLPNQISSLTRAIIMLGLNTVKNLALSTAILNTVGNESSQILPMDLFWTHSISVGVTAKNMAELKGIPFAQREEFFIGGLLHDLGKIVLINCFIEEYDAVINQVRNEQGALDLAEKSVFGFDHGEPGRMIAEKWKLNSSVTETLCFHHQPDKAEENNRDLVSAVSLANMYTNILDIGSAGDPYQNEYLLTAALDRVDISWEQLVEMDEKIQDEIEKAQVFLQVSREGGTA